MGLDYMTVLYAVTGQGPEVVSLLCTIASLTIGYQGNRGGLVWVDYGRPYSLKPPRRGIRPKGV